MDVPERAIRAHCTLVFYELSLVPLSFLAIFFALLLSGGILSGIELVGDSLDVGSTAQSGLTALVVVATIACLSAIGGAVVRGYQRFFDRSFGSLDPRRLCAIPLLAFVGAIGYAIASPGPISSPWWVALVAILSAHALVFRSIAVFSMLDHAKRTGSRVGTVAAIPAVLALVTLVTQEVLNADLNEAGGLVVSTLTAAGIPQVPATVILAPLIIGGAYGVGTREETPPIDRPELSLPRLSLPFSIDLSLIDDHWPPGDSARSSKTTSGSSSRSRSGEAPPPSSPHTSDATGGSTGGNSGRSGRSVFRGGSSATDRSDTTANASENAPDESAAPKDAAGNSPNASEDSADESGNASPRSTSPPRDGEGAADEPSNDPADAGDTGTAAAEPADHTAASSVDGTGTETRIFTDDFGEYGSPTGAGEPGKTEPKTCPDCERDLPGDSEYCPHCGAERRA